MPTNDYFDMLQWDLDSHVESAELYLEDHRYNEAIACLNAALALDACHFDSLRLRATAWAGLGSGEEFEADVEKCIQLAPHRVEPYLMMKDHLLSRGKIYEAIQLLRTATFRVYFDDPELVRLKDAYEQLKSTEYNHLIQLPAEIITLIFSFLPFTTLVTCIAVSRTWHNSLISIPALWGYIDFGNPAVHKQQSIIASLQNFSFLGTIYRLRVSLCDRTLGVLMRSNQCNIRELDITGYSVRVDDLLLVMAMRQLGSTWQRVSISSAIRTPRIFFTAAAIFCPQLTALTIKSFYHSTPDTNNNDQEVEYDIMDDLGISVDDTTPLAIQTLTLEQSVLNTSTLQALFSRCAGVQKFAFIQCKSMLSSGRFFDTMVRFLPTTTTINNMIIEQVNTNGYETCIFGIHPTDLCTMLRTRPPKHLNLNKCDMYRESVEAIVESMSSGTLLRYNKTFYMNQAQSRATLQTCMRVDRTWQMIVDEIERETIQTWMDSQGWDEDDYMYYDYYEDMMYEEW